MNPETNDANQPKDVISDYAEELQQIEMKGYQRAIRKARNALFWAAGLYFFWEMVGMFRSEGSFNIAWFIIALIEAGIFLALAFLTNTKPFTAIIAGIIYFVALNILSAFVLSLEDGSLGVAKALFSGIIVKVIIIVNLIVPWRDAKAFQEARRSSKK
jgi:hypothetical protein